MSYVSVAPGSPPEMLGALTRLAPIAPTSPVGPIAPIVPPTKKLEVIRQPTDFSNRRPAVQPPAAPPGAGLPPPGAAPGADAGAPAADAPAAKKFPIIPVAVGVAVLAFLLMRR
jgi:hypothetical protein